MPPGGAPAVSLPVRVEILPLPAVQAGDQRRRKWHLDSRDDSTWQPVPHHVELAHHDVVRAALWAILKDRDATMALADNRMVTAYATVPGVGLVHVTLAVPTITTIREDELKAAV